MAPRSFLATKALLLLQLSTFIAASLASEAGGSGIDSLLVGFSITGATAAKQANITAISQALATAAGVPPKTVAAVNATEAFRTTKPQNGNTQVAFAVTVVNLAAPYAMLTALPADKALQQALKKGGVQYVAKTLQVSAPAWIIQTEELPDTDSNHTRMSFTMSGVPLPAVDQFRLRAVIATVAGVRIEAVLVKTISYAVAPSVLPPPVGRKMLAASGYDTLQVVVGVDTEAAAKTGLLGAATVAQVLARQLKLVLGATYNEGSLLVDQIPAAKDMKSESKNHKVTLGLTLGVGLAVLLVAAVCLGGIVLHYRRKAQAASASGEHALSKLVTNSIAPQQELALKSSDIAGAKPVAASV